MGIKSSGKKVKEKLDIRNAWQFVNATLRDAGVESAIETSPSSLGVARTTSKKKTVYDPAERVKIWTTVVAVGRVRYDERCSNNSQLIRVLLSVQRLNVIFDHELRASLDPTNNGSVPSPLQDF